MLTKEDKKEIGGTAAFYIVILLFVIVVVIWLVSCALTGSVPFENLVCEQKPSDMPTEDSYMKIYIDPVTGINYFVDLDTGRMTPRYDSGGNLYVSEVI